MAELLRVFRAPGPPRLSAGPAVAPELAVRFRPYSVGVPALHLMRSGCLSHPGALAARTRSPWNTPASAQNAHGFAGPPTRWNAQTHCATTHSSAPRDARAVPGPGKSAAGGSSPAACDPARRSGGSRPWVGEGRLADPFLPFLPQLSPLLPQLSVRLLCFPFAAGWVRLLATLAPASSPPGLLLFVRVSFAFPLP